MLDKLPAWARHLLIVAGAAAGGFIITNIQVANGVTAIDWPTVLQQGLNVTAVAVASAAAALWTTPLTRQYGVGAEKPPVA